MLKETRVYKITEVEPKLLEYFYKIMISCRDLYGNKPQPVVQIVVLKNQEKGLTVDISTYGTNRDFIELCEVYESLFKTLETFS